MGSFKAKLFNRNAADKSSKPERIIKETAVAESMAVADIGAGGGYYSYRFARIVGTHGRVYAIDVNGDYLAFICENARARGFANLTTVSADMMHQAIPAESLDMVFMRNTYHHLSDRVEYFSRLKKLLKKGGLLAVIEWNGRGGVSIHKMTGHYVKEDTILKEVGDAGYERVKRLDFLPKQSFNLFRALD